MVGEDSVIENTNMLCNAPTPRRTEATTTEAKPVTVPVADVFLVTERAGRPTEERLLFTINVTKSAPSVRKQLREIVERSNFQPGDEFSVALVAQWGRRKGQVIGRATVAPDGGVKLRQEKDPQVKAAIEKKEKGPGVDPALALLKAPTLSREFITTELLAAAKNISEERNAKKVPEAGQKKERQAETERERLAAEKDARELATSLRTGPLPIAPRAEAAKETLGEKFRARIAAAEQARRGTEELAKEPAQIQTLAPRAHAERQADPLAAKAPAAATAIIPDTGLLAAITMPRIDRAAIRQETLRENLALQGAEGKLKLILLDQMTSGTTPVNQAFYAQLSTLFGSELARQLGQTAATAVAQPEAPAQARTGIALRKAATQTAATPAVQPALEIAMESLADLRGPALAIAA